MKKLQFIIIVLVLFFNARAQSMQDAFGYSWKSDTSAGGPTYNWVDISSGSTELTGFTDDNFVGPVPIGFSFRFYWLDYSEVYVGSNGYITFGKGYNIASGSSGMPNIPTPGAPSNIIAPYLADLTFTDSAGTAIPAAKVFYKTIGTDSFVITYQDIPFWTDDTSGHYRGACTFQIVLSRLDSSITLNYQKCIGPADAAYTASGKSFVTRGIENITGNVGLTFPRNVYPVNNTIRITYPPSTSFAVKDIEAYWCFDTDNSGTFTVAGQPLTLNAAIRNTGTVDIADNVRVIANITDKDFNLLHADTVMVTTGVLKGTVNNITFPKPFNANTEGNFIYKITTSLTGDQFNANNTTQAELVVVDTSQSPVLLRFDDAIWSSQEDDAASLTVGVYFKMPYYPITISGLNYGIITSKPDDPSKVNGFKAKMYADGANGPGTLLFSKTVPKEEVLVSEAVEAVDNLVTTETPIVITSGGVYVSWEPILDDSLYNPLAMDNSLPISNRTFEISGGVWAPYRDRTTNDMAIGLVVETKTVSRNNDLTKQMHLTAIPNPASNITNISYTLPTSGNASIIVRNVMGQVVFQQELGNLAEGNHIFEFNTENLTNGVYSYAIVMNGGQASSKLVVTH